MAAEIINPRVVDHFPVNNRVLRAEAILGDIYRNIAIARLEWGWEIWPQGLTDGIMMIKARYGDIPIYITENGLGAKDPIIDGEVDRHRQNHIAFDSR